MEVQTPAEQLLFATVRIEADTPRGTSTGTAFVFSYQDGDRHYLFLVSNKHVIADAMEGRFFFTRQGDDGNPVIGERLDVFFDGFRDAWHGHPDPDIDVSAMPLVPILEKLQGKGGRAFFRYVSSDMIPDSEQTKALDAVENILFVGYPNGIFDAKNLMPVIRRGISATPFQVDYEGNSVFLIDASVFPGSSGSPVFILDSGSYKDRMGNVHLGESRFLFLGIVAEVLVKPETGRLEFQPIPTTQQPVVTTAQMIDLGVVYKSSAVMETVLDLLKARGL